MIYKILNKETKNWWWHKSLRKDNKLKEARQLERKSILDTIANLRLVLKYGGYLSLGRKAYSLEINNHPSSFSKGSSTSISVQGHYDLNRSTHYEAICHALKIPIVDTRNINDEQVWDLIKMPLIAKDERDLTYDNSGYISLKKYVDLATKMFYSNFITHYVN